VARLISVALNPDNYPKDIAGRMVDRKLFLEYFDHIKSVRKFCEEMLGAHPGSSLQIPVFFIEMIKWSSWLCYVTGFFKDGLAHVETAERVLDALEHDGATLIRAPTPGHIPDVILGIYHSHACIATEIGDFKLSLRMFPKQMDFYEAVVRDGTYKPLNNDRLGVILEGIVNSHQGLGDHFAGRVVLSPLPGQRRSEG